MIIMLTKTFDTCINSPCGARRPSVEYTECDFIQLYPYIRSKQNLIGATHLHIL